MNAPAEKRLTAPEFLAWCETKGEGRFELYCGEIFAMAPERVEHGRAKAAIWRALADALAHTGAPCEAFVDSLGVAVDAQTIYQPDVLVDCGDKIPTGSLLAPAPAIIVEVISPSSRKLDQSLKLTDYFRVPSLVHYLIVDLERRYVLHYRRQGEEPITLRILRDGSIRLDPPGLDLATSDIFA